MFATLRQYDVPCCELLLSKVLARLMLCVVHFRIPSVNHAQMYVH